MKTLKNNFAVRRLWAFALVFAIAIGMFGSTTAFAAEAQDLPLASDVNEAVTPRVTVAMHGSTHDYVRGAQELGKFEIKRTSPWPSTGQKELTIAYAYEDKDHSHQARLEFKTSDGNGTRNVYLDDTNGKTAVSVLYNTEYTVTIYPGCGGEYMASVNVYY